MGSPSGWRWSKLSEYVIFLNCAELDDMKEQVINFLNKKTLKPKTSRENENFILKDKLKRPLRDLRISVTDRCNFRCTYCMPKEVFNKNYKFLPQNFLLSFEEITNITKIFINLGIEKVRLTGGEPLLRKNLETLIQMLSNLDTTNSKKLDLTMTTNASLLTKKAQALKNAGLSRLTISLDSLSNSIFQKMNDVDYPVSDVLKGIESAKKVGFKEIKVNMVVKKGVNDSEIIPMAKYFKNSGIILRFIEYMDVGNSNNWKMNEVIPSKEVIERINEEMPVSEIGQNYFGETAQRWRYDDNEGEIGVISSVTEAFCKDCNRLRVSTEGKLFTCLFATGGHDLRTLIRNKCSNEEIQNFIINVWSNRIDRYSEVRSLKNKTKVKNKIEMSYIGG